MYWLLLGSLMLAGYIDLDMTVGWLQTSMSWPLFQPSVFAVNALLDWLHITFSAPWQLFTQDTLILFFNLWLVENLLKAIHVGGGRLIGLYSPDQYRIWAWICWQPLGRWLAHAASWWEENFIMGTEASAQWESHLEPYRTGQVLLGRSWAAGFGGLMPVGISAERHFVMIAGSGSGKTTLLITLLALHRGTSFVIDPKGQISKVLKKRQGQGGNGIVGKGMTVWILDPYRIVDGTQQASWNVFDELDAATLRHGPDCAVRYASKIAEGLIKQDDPSQPFFVNAAREFIKGLVLHIHQTEPSYRRNLVRLRELLNVGYREMGDDGFDALLDLMLASPHYDGVIANAAAALKNAGANARGDVLATARQQTSFLDLPEIRKISTESDFSLADLKTGDLNLAVCAPVGAIQSELSQWFRLLTVLAMYLFENIPGKLAEPCLFAVDEMPSLGNISAIETAAPVMRSYGVRLLAITQDIEKLQQAYPQSWGGFIGNAEAVWWMATNHEQTVLELEKSLGSRTRQEAIDGDFFRQYAKTDDQSQEQLTQVERPLLYGEQIKRYLHARKANLIVTRFGLRPLRLKNAPYFKELPVTFYEADPDYREAVLRSITRRLLRALHGKTKSAPTEATALEAEN